MRGLRAWEGTGRPHQGGHIHSKDSQESAQAGASCGCGVQSRDRPPGPCRQPECVFPQSLAIEGRPGNMLPSFPKTNLFAGRQRSYFAAILADTPWYFCRHFCYTAQRFTQGPKLYPFPAQSLFPPP